VNDEGALEQHVRDCRLGESTAPYRDDSGWKVEHIENAAPLESAEGWFAVGEELGDRPSTARLDLTVGVDERSVEKARQLTSHRRLADAHEAHQGDRSGL
jgi:hypothetical protein